MSEETVILHCSPTMAGLKTGSLFACPVRDRRALDESVREMNRRLVPRGLRLLPVYCSDHRALLYMYRPRRLKEDLKNGKAREILLKRHYPAENADQCVAELVRRLQTDADFPHEVGLFLGYPPEDVDGFLRHGAREAKCVGTWKVYGDAEQARKTFALYKKCTRLYCRAYGKHHSFEKLLVKAS